MNLLQEHLIYIWAISKHFTSYLTNHLSVGTHVLSAK